MASSRPPVTPRRSRHGRAAGAVERGGVAPSRRMSSCRQSHGVGTSATEAKRTPCRSARRKSRFAATMKNGRRQRRRSKTTRRYGDPQRASATRAMDRPHHVDSGRRANPPPWAGSGEFRNWTSTCSFSHRVSGRGTRHVEQCPEVFRRVIIAGFSWPTEWRRYGRCGKANSPGNRLAVSPTRAATGRFTTDALRAGKTKMS